MHNSVRQSFQRVLCDRHDGHGGGDLALTKLQPNPGGALATSVGSKRDRRLADREERGVQNIAVGRGAGCICTTRQAAESAEHQADE